MAARDPVEPPADGPERRPARLDPPSLVQLAAEELRRMILAAELEPGERLIEERLTARLGISRPPLREAMRILQHEGLIVVQPRRGATVTRLSDGDVFEILTLRSALERLAVELGVPVTVAERLQRCRAALAEMEACAAREDRAHLVECGYEFHRAVVGLAGHRRLEGLYDSLHQQLLLCMALNLFAREHYYEDLARHVERHRVLLDVIEAGDPKAVLDELAAHGERSFTRHQRHH
ncbi:MAG TPA: GntR family transcriptional regulator [Actinopolymorphaceae bacterium]|nr:GntR family transcriptional regulator [Actinopolymorphaceae bacterium]